MNTTSQKLAKAWGIPNSVKVYPSPYRGIIVEFQVVAPKLTPTCHTLRIVNKKDVPAKLLELAECIGKTAAQYRHLMVKHNL